MSRKKSSYAEKHSVYVPEESVLSSAFWEKNKDLLAVMSSPYDFYDNFKELEYSRQIAMIELFRSISAGNIVISPRSIKQQMLDLVYDELEQIHWMTGSYYEEGNAYYPIADDEKKLVRMECYGTIDVRREHELSSYYKFFNKPENKGKFRLRDYNLKESPMWRVFNQFESFRSIAPNVRRYLYTQGINPDALKVMSVNDFCDVIHAMYAKKPDSMKARFLPLGYKNKFVISFMRHCGKDLEKHLISRGIDERKVKSLCRMMKQYGLCDVDRVVITETHCTQRVLDDLKSHHYDVSAYKVGDQIPETLMNEIFDNRQESLLLARDENGIPLTKEDLPRFEVHHKNAVKFAHSDDYLAKVNYNGNLLLVEKEIHRAYYHGFDHIIPVNQNNERYFSRINSTSSEMCMIDGFDATRDMFFYNLENTLSARRRAKQDKENVVNYYEMQYERLNNIQKIADRYNIEYSKTDLNKEYKNLQELTQFKVNISAEDIKMFEKWFNQNTNTPKQNSKQKKRNKSPIVPPHKPDNER
ncbi:MAG: hypothetical protein IJ770_01515 [Alphaproteobacteria bacterium]|nr:hypothetical protein [Alphaproteobacteria bacterium]